MKELTFVVQGPYFQHTDRNHISSDECFRTLRKYFPDSKIIYSRSDNVVIPLEVLSLIDLIVCPDDVGPNQAGCINSIPKFENVNRQIHGVVAGLELVESIYCCKVRSDFKFINNNLIDILPSLLVKASRFKGRLTILDIYSRTEYFKFGGRSYVDYHLSDFIFIGYSEDVIKYWKGELFGDTDKNYLHYDDYRTVEQMLGRRFYKNYFSNIEINSERNVSLEECLLAKSRIQEDFNFLSFKKLGLDIPRRFKRPYRDQAYFINGNIFGRLVYNLHFINKFILKKSGLRDFWNKLKK
ncbi:WavE lipopolysaccharide synthesis family protein [Shewanella xiamenensis]|uniref:WavE lipopolysaccharide synthesis family protein n=1 Tax=Shewanella TaxID=22 RepID=UPI00005E0726|nr:MULTISPECIES: WavE lipopolysaccharide synthesis family protein [Shewanella]ABK50314.1 hypothetical protein Shewana3_4097 [Shewanella sp. ANA-3]MDH1314739.1 WavE lipopolysaccharide synthesis family protein [Shewanella xiamenensis]